MSAPAVDRTTTCQHGDLIGAYSDSYGHYAQCADCPAQFDVDEHDEVDPLADPCDAWDRAYEMHRDALVGL